MTVQLKVDGLQDLLRKTTPGRAIIRPAMLGAMDAIGRAATTSARSGAPHRTGELAKSMRYEVRGKGIPWVNIQARALAQSDGYPYPRLLEYSPKHNHKGWLKRSIQRTRGRLTSALQAATAEIQRRWQT